MSNVISTSFSKGSAVALGFFDGVHVGHAAILSETKRLAALMGLSSVAFTFDRHPAAVVDPLRAPLLLSTPAEREALIKELGIDEVVTAKFDREFADMAPERFVREILCGSLRARAVAFGYDYRFGARGVGDACLLRSLAGELGFRVLQIPPVRMDGSIVSSTLIRQRLMEGDVEGAAHLLGRRYSLSGQVSHGRKRGRQMGFPTANITPPSYKLIPTDGVYVAEVSIPPDKSSYMGLVSIGAKPTFDDNCRTIEVYIDGHQGELYGKEVCLAFAARLRGIEKYETMEELKKQISLDLSAARSLWGQLSSPL